MEQITNYPQIQVNRIPKHVAIIMDGNGRWAKKQGLMRIFGHRRGVDAVRGAIEFAAEVGIKYVTMYAFSTENWNRPAIEVNALMQLLVDSIEKELPALMKNGIRLKTLGNIAELPGNCAAQLKKAEEKTKDNVKTTLVLALSYSGRWDIIEAMKTNPRKKALQLNFNIVTEQQAACCSPDAQFTCFTSTKVQKLAYPPAASAATSRDMRQFFVRVY